MQHAQSRGAGWLPALVPRLLIFLT